MTKKISFKEFMNLSEVKKDMDELTSVIEDDAVAMAMIGAARTVEDLFVVSKRFIQMSFNDFKRIFQKVSDYFSSDKTPLPPDMLDHVVGGAVYADIFESTPKKIHCLCGCVVGGAWMMGGLAQGNVDFLLSKK